jgi:hypothetical protein
VRFLAATITWLAIMSAGGIILWFAMTGIGLTGTALAIVAIGWVIPVGCIATVAAIAVFNTFEP